MLEQLYSIVNSRYEEQRSIVITTNIDDHDALCDQIGARTVSRLTEMCGRRCCCPARTGGSRRGCA